MRGVVGIQGVDGLLLGEKSKERPTDRCKDSVSEEKISESIRGIPLTQPSPSWPPRHSRVPAASKSPPKRIYQSLSGYRPLEAKEPVGKQSNREYDIHKNGMSG